MLCIIGLLADHFAGADRDTIFWGAQELISPQCLESIKTVCYSGTKRRCLKCVVPYVDSQMGVCSLKDVALFCYESGTPVAAQQLVQTPIDLRPDGLSKPCLFALCCRKIDRKHFPHSRMTADNTGPNDRAVCNPLLHQLGRNVLVEAKARLSNSTDINGNCVDFINRHPSQCRSMNGPCVKTCKERAINVIQHNTLLLLAHTADVCQFLTEVKRAHKEMAFISEPAVLRPLIELCECSKHLYGCKMPRPAARSILRLKEPRLNTLEPKRGESSATPPPKGAK
jgi:hypothetical protein